MESDRLMQVGFRDKGCHIQTIILTLQSLKSNPPKDEETEEEEKEGQFDMSLLRFLSVFIYIDLGFQFFSGITLVSQEYKRGWLSISLSILEAGNVVALTTFLTELHHKVWSEL